MKISISTDTNGNLRVDTVVEQGNLGRVAICLSEDLVEKTDVLCLNSGVPGVVGPDIPFSITEVLDPILERCSAVASRGI